MTDDEFEAVMSRVDGYLFRLPNHQARAVARRKLINRLKHPELGGHPQSAPPPPPPSHGGGEIIGPPCLACGGAKGGHDIDGQRSDCDGYIPTR